ncbi:MAG: hypothetical protein IJD33_06235, partial [Clostridia bacterium]|nr:hypothetical protein [Clostridia bacterium]
CHITWLIFDGKLLRNTVCICSVTDHWGYAPSQNTCLSCIFLVKSLKDKFQLKSTILCDIALEN